MAEAALDKDDYKEPCKMTLAQWLDIWANIYLGGVKPRTIENYKGNPYEAIFLVTIFTGMRKAAH